MSKNIKSLQLSQSDLWEKAAQQKYVWIKTEDNFITKDNLSVYTNIKTSLYDIYLSQKDYGKTWAFTKDELMKESD